MIPGGSNIPIVVQTMKRVDIELSEKLVLLQTDERYVAPDNPNCNWRQLLDEGLDIKNAKAFPIIIDENESLQEVSHRYNETLRQVFKDSDYVIAQFGFGSDFHIAGIKPNSPATESPEMVCGYKADDFERVTMTFSAIRQVDYAIVIGSGESKKKIIENLKDSSSTKNVDMFPIGILNELNSCEVYSDQV